MGPALREPQQKNCLLATQSASSVSMVSMDIGQRRQQLGRKLLEGDRWKLHSAPYR
jgi:hypothetical protein